jgi:hypothetical protein
VRTNHTLEFDDRPTCDSSGRPLVSPGMDHKPFWEWFRQSHVVDQAGRPEVVCHATLWDFGTFELGKGQGQSDGFFFADKASSDRYLRSYLDSLKYQEVEREGDYITMPVFLALQNPKYLDTSDTENWADPDYENEQIRLAKAFGYDGLIITDTYMGTKFYVAFAAQQIKSAIGNPGSFHKRDKHITDGHELTLGAEISLYSTPNHGGDEEPDGGAVLRRRSRP